MPVSLAVGTVQTPEFPVASHGYWIMIQGEKPLPFKQMECMMGVTQGPLDSKNCSSNDPLLRADWTVWDGNHIVSSGSSTTAADAKYTTQYIFKFLGKFLGEAGKNYVVKVNFTKDGTPLNVANPHLIVVRIGYE
jgi:acyl-homoserine lactone acylase PvdQ